MNKFSVENLLKYAPNTKGSLPLAASVERIVGLVIPERPVFRDEFLGLLPDTAYQILPENQGRN